MTDNTSFIESPGLMTARAVLVAFSRARRRAFVAPGAERVGGFGIDRLLQPPLGQMADQITPLADIGRRAQLGQGGLGQSQMHRPGAHGPTRKEIKRLFAWRVRADRDHRLRRNRSAGGETTAEASLTDSRDGTQHRVDVPQAPIGEPFID